MDAALDEDEEGSGSGSEGSASEAEEGESEDEDEGEEEEEEEEEEEVKKAGKKRKAAPRPRGRPRKAAKKARTKAAPKPKAKAHPKASASRLPHAVEIDALPTDPYERALRLLHVGATPESLPCREDEFVDVLSRVEDGVESGGGGCLCKWLVIEACCREARLHLAGALVAGSSLARGSLRSLLTTDIAGVPGTGKTATVHAVVKELKRRAEDGEIAPFSYVEINGLKIPSPAHAYSVLWEEISGQRGTSAKTALRGLEAHFGRKSGVRGPRSNT
jgi:origin recognition complex subunit 1